MITKTVNCFVVSVLVMMAAWTLVLFGMCIVFPFAAHVVVFPFQLSAAERAPMQTQPETTRTRTFNIVRPPERQGDSYAVIVGDSLVMRGSQDDAATVRQLSSKMHGDYIWFERDGKSYIVDDPALIQQAASFTKHQEELGRRQAELGDQQAKLGEEQARLGEFQAKNGEPDLFKELAALELELKQLRQENTQESLAKIKSKIAQLQSKLNQPSSQAGKQQVRLSEQQSKLASEQSRLGEQQTRLSEEASRNMKILIDRALSTGKAKGAE